MIKTTSYRTKHRRLQKALQILEWSSINEIADSCLVEKTISPPQDVNNDCINKSIYSSYTSSLSEHNNNIINTHFYKSCDNNLNQNYLSNIICTQDDADSNSISIPLTQSSVYSKNIKNKLRTWMVNFNVPQNASNALLKILKNDANLNFPPVDSRTLLQSGSKKVFNVREIEPNGIYYHFGLENGINMYSKIFSLDDIISIAIGIDGLPLSKSSSSQFWPILAYIFPYNNNVFPIGIYYGHNKPQDSNIFIKDFVAEMLKLSTHGIVINNITKKVIIKAICCDAPARSFVMRNKGHAGYFSCSRCVIEGEYLENRVCFPFIDNCEKRTHHDYITMKDEEHHTSSIISSLVMLPDLDIVNIFSLDYMHLVCLGVVRKLIIFWQHKGPMTVRLPSWKIRKITNSLMTLKTNITNDFPRKPRAIEDVARWKATEFRQFLLYTGLVVLKNILSRDCYENFMALSIAMRILFSPNYKQYVECARKLLVYFVKSFEQIYGSQFMSYNFHSIIHLPDDYIRFGPLDCCSAFPFENYMKDLKNMLRKHENPSQQVVRRYEEKCKSGSIEHNSDIEKVKFTTKEPNCYFSTQSGEIVKITEIVSPMTSNNKIFIGKIFLNQEEMFVSPLKSSKLNIYNVNNLSQNLYKWDFFDIKMKMMIFHFEGLVTAIPIIHS